MLSSNRHKWLTLEQLNGEDEDVVVEDDGLVKMETCKFHIRHSYVGLCVHKMTKQKYVGDTKTFISSGYIFSY